MAKVEAVLFDVFGTVVDWRSSLIADLSAFGASKGIAADWATLVDDWRGAYVGQMDRVRRGEMPWTNLDALHRDALDRLLRKFGLDHLDEAARDHINRGWHRLRPWPDAVHGLQALKRKVIIGTLSNGNVALLLNMARNAGLPWDMIFSAELFRHYKPDPEVYLGACALLGRAPDCVMLCAAHNDDLAAARTAGLKTGFVARPTEYGPRQTRDFKAESDWDVIAPDFVAFARAFD